MASPSAVSWMSHSIEKLPATAASAAAGMFSMMPRLASCRPRWATGRAVSQSGARTLECSAISGDFEQSLDLDGRVRRQRGDAHGGAGMAALVAERQHHQIGGAIQHFRSVEKIRRRIDEAAEPDHAHDLVEVAGRRLDLRQQVDGAAARGGVALLDGHAGAELALGDQLTFRVEADLAGNEQQVTGADESDIVRHW